MKLESHGIQTNLPPGWEGRITVRRKPEAVPGDDGGAAPSARVFSPEHHVSAGGVTAIGDATEQILPVVHLGNFPLPGDRGDFGSGAVDVMTDLDVLLVLAEYGPECAGTALFSHQGIPTRLTPNMFSASALQRTLPGQAGCQVWFTAEDRAFCLYAVLGRQSNARRVLPAAVETLADTRIQPR
ncbi:MAG: hypothetical protein KF906_10950 [Actinobacteria bacterium]|nr:hypothetical protein [Actinomycetota bacterium]